MKSMCLPSKHLGLSIWKESLGCSGRGLEAQRSPGIPSLVRFPFSPRAFWLSRFYSRSSISPFSEFSLRTPYKPHLKLALGRHRGLRAPGQERSAEFDNLTAQFGLCGSP